MSSGKGTATVPEAYRGREQAYIKHRLLESYLEKLFLIIGMSAQRLGVTELCYVDCFAGPWGDESQDLASTSIAKSLHILDKCQRVLAQKGISTRIRALYVEKDKEAFARLQRYLSLRASGGTEATAKPGDFIALRDDILRWCGSKAFVFFFIDPTGWKEVGIDVLRLFLARRRSEFLVNFMYDFVNRTVSMAEWKAEMATLLGEPVEVEDQHGSEREKTLINTYRNNLKQHVFSGGNWAPRSAYVRVLDREKERLKYHLVYLTSHPRGIIEFMEISERLDMVQKQVRAETRTTARAKKSGMNDLFGAETFVNPEAGHASIDEVEQRWIEYLSGGERRVGAEEFADLLEETDWFPGDFQRALVRLIESRRVCNLDAPGKRPKNPLHWKQNERLALREKA